MGDAPKIEFGSSGGIPSKSMFEGTRVCGDLHQLEFGGSLKQRERKIEMNSEGEGEREI